MSRHIINFHWAFNTIHVLHYLLACWYYMASRILGNTASGNYLLPESPKPLLTPMLNYHKQKINNKILLNEKSVNNLHLKSGQCKICSILRGCFVSTAKLRSQPVRKKTCIFSHWLRRFSALYVNWDVTVSLLFLQTMPMPPLYLGDVRRKRSLESSSRKQHSTMKPWGRVKNRPAANDIWIHYVP